MFFLKNQHMDNKNAFASLLVNFALLQQLNQLIGRYDGWCSDYVGDEATALQIAGQLMRSMLASDHLPSVALQQLCVDAICESELTHWSAIDMRTKSQWDPLSQSYKDFQSDYPEAEPYVALKPSAAWPSRLASYLSHQ